MDDRGSRRAPAVVSIALFKIEPRFSRCVPVTRSLASTCFPAHDRLANYQIAGVSPATSTWSRAVLSTAEAEKTGFGPPAAQSNSRSSLCTLLAGKAL